MKGQLTILHARGKVVTTVRDLDAPPAIETLQRAVNGQIEAVLYFSEYNGENCVAFCNEDGKLDGLSLNVLATMLAGPEFMANDVLFGDVAIVTGDDELLEAL